MIIPFSYGIFAYKVLKNYLMGIMISISRERMGYGRDRLSNRKQVKTLNM